MSFQKYTNVSENEHFQKLGSKVGCGYHLFVSTERDTFIWTHSHLENAHHLTGTFRASYASF